MSHIDDLIDELSPKGVEFLPMGQVGKLVRGNGMPKTDFTDSGVGCIHYGQIYTHYGVWATETKSFVAPEKAARLAKVEPGDLVITNTSENIDDVCKAVAWLGARQIVTGGHATVFKHEQDPKFLSYYLQTAEFFAKKKKHATGTKVIDVSANALAKIRIPVPPLEVQREIVRILDTFTDLEAELEAELEARRLQYEHYREKRLLSLRASSVQFRELGRWQGGMTPSKAEPRYWEGGTIPWLASMDVSESGSDVIRGRITPAALQETPLRIVDAPSVVVVMRSNILRRRLPVGLVARPTTVNQDVRALVPRDGVDAEYVYQFLQAESESIRAACVRTDGSMAAVDSKSFLVRQIPLPSLAEQRQVAADLRAFDALVNDVSVGLPAELTARRQQYEYYRDQLLAFEEAAP